MSESALDISPGCKDKRGRADVSVLAGNALVRDQGLLLSFIRSSIVDMASY
jgi:hypothetical protein